MADLLYCCCCHFLITHYSNDTNDALILALRGLMLGMLDSIKMESQSMAR